MSSATGADRAGQRVVFHLAEPITVLTEGAVLAEGTPAEIAADERVQAAPSAGPPTASPLGVGYVPEGRRIFPKLTVAENLAAPLERPGPWTIARIHRLVPRLQERRAKPGPAALRRRAENARDRPRAATQPGAAAA